MPLISVVIPTKDRASLVKRAVDSVLGQSFEDFQLIVVDDGSSDNTPELLLELYPTITLIEQQNKGVANARNAGVNASSGELIAFLDSDDQWAPLKLEKQVEVFKKKGNPYICHTDEIWIWNGKEINQKSYHKKQGGFFFERCLERCLISPSSVIISRDIFETVGLFDESMPAGEDYDLWLRIGAFYEISYIPEKLVIKYGGHNGQLSRTIPAIDRYRIQAIEKILSQNTLTPRQREVAIKELERKCHIMALGCSKRGKGLEAEHYREIPSKYKN